MTASALGGNLRRCQSLALRASFVSAEMVYRSTDVHRGTIRCLPASFYQGPGRILAPLLIDTEGLSSGAVCQG